MTRPHYDDLDDRTQGKICQAFKHDFAHARKNRTAPANTQRPNAAAPRKAEGINLVPRWPFRHAQSTPIMAPTTTGRTPNRMIKPCQNP